MASVNEGAGVGLLYNAVLVRGTIGSVIYFRGAPTGLGIDELELAYAKLLGGVDVSHVCCISDMSLGTLSVFCLLGVLESVPVAFLLGLEATRLGRFVAGAEASSPAIFSPDSVILSASLFLFLPCVRVGVTPGPEVVVEGILLPVFAVEVLLIFIVSAGG